MLDCVLQKSQVVDPMACDGSELVVIHGFDHGTTLEDLKNYMKDVFQEKLLNLWLDPFQRPRGVAFLSEKKSEGQLQEMCENNAFQGKILFMNCSDTTSGIFVQTHKPEMVAARDKLYWKLQKQPVRSSITDIAPLNDTGSSDCFLVTFTEGWAAVLRACEKEWIVEGTQLSIKPYFKCFQRNVELQYATFLPNKVKKQDIGRNDSSSDPALLPNSNPDIKYKKQDIGQNDNFSDATPLPNSNTDIKNNKQNIGQNDSSSDPSPLPKGNTDVKWKIQDDISNSGNEQGLTLNIDSTVKTATNQTLESPISREKKAVDQSCNSPQHGVLHKDDVLPAKTKNVSVQKETRKRSTHPSKEMNVPITICLNSEFVLLLQKLHFTDNSICVTLKPKKGEISMQGPSVLVNQMKSELANESEKFEMDESMQEFLESVDSWQGRLVETWAKVFLESDSTKHRGLMVQTSTGEIPLLDFMMDLKDPDERGVYSGDEESSTTKANFTVNTAKQHSLESPMSRGKNPVHQSPALSQHGILDEDDFVHVSMPNSTDSWESEVFDFIIHKDSDVVQFLEKYMLRDIKHMKKKFDCEIRFQHDHVQISSGSKKTAFVDAPEALEKLTKRIEIMTKQVDFPGFIEFCESHEGKTVISEISEKHHCLIVSKHGSNSQRRSSNAMLGDPRKVLCVPMLGGATNMGWCRLFILQCQPKDVDMRMQLSFFHDSQVNECKVKSSRDSHTLEIHLPPLYKESDIEDHKAALQECIMKIIRQMNHLKEKNMAVCFDVAQASDGRGNLPFPVDNVAQVMVQTLQNYGRGKENSSLDFFLCEMSRESVVKAFIFHLQHYVPTPYTQVWEEISFLDQEEYPDYDLILKEKNMSVKIDSSLPFRLPDWSLVFTPCDINENGSLIVETLDYEHKRASTSTEYEIKRNPGVVEMDTFFGRPPFLFYSSQAWGFDIDKAIERSVHKCLQRLHGWQVSNLYLIPPCLSPDTRTERYVARKVFLCLDEFLKALSLDGTARSIHLIVRDKGPKEIYQQELASRCRTPKKKGWVETVSSYLFSPDPEKENRTQAKIIHTPLTYTSKREHVKIIGTKLAEIQHASKELNENLGKIYKTRKLKLNATETRTVENILRDGDVIIDVNGHKHHEKKEIKKKNKKKKKNKTLYTNYPLTGSTLHLKAQSDTILEHFIGMIRTQNPGEEKEKREMDTDIDESPSDTKAQESSLNEETSKGQLDPLKDEDKTKKGLATNTVSDESKDRSDDNITKLGQLSSADNLKESIEVGEQQEERMEVDDVKDNFGKEMDTDIDESAFDNKAQKRSLNEDMLKKQLNPLKDKDKARKGVATNTVSDERKDKSDDDITKLGQWSSADNSKKSIGVYAREEHMQVDDVKDTLGKEMETDIDESSSDTKAQESSLNEDALKEQLIPLKDEDKTQEGLAANTVSDEWKDNLGKEVFQHRQTEQVVRERELSFTWLFESQTNDLAFQCFENSVSSRLEAAFQNNEKSIDLQGQGLVDFSTMTLQQKNGTFGIIRQEKLPDGHVPVQFPDTWNRRKPISLEKVDKEGPEYAQIEKALFANANNRNLDIMRIERVENKELFQRWSSKKMENIQSVVMWQRVSRGNKKKICQFGFHPYLMKNDKAASVGRGVGFHQSISNCIRDSDEGHDILIARVLVRTEGGSEGETRERNNGEGDDMHMVFSDAQAYPSHFVVVHVEENEEEEEEEDL